MPKQRRYHHGDLRASLIEAVFARLALPPDRAAETEELAAVLWGSVHGAADLVMSRLIPAPTPSASASWRGWPASSIEASLIPE